MHKKEDLQRVFRCASFAFFCLFCTSTGLAALATVFAFGYVSHSFFVLCCVSRSEVHVLALSALLLIFESCSLVQVLFRRATFVCGLKEAHLA